MFLSPGTVLGDLPATASMADKCKDPGVLGSIPMEWREKSSVVLSLVRMLQGKSPYCPKVRIHASKGTLSHWSLRSN